MPNPFDRIAALPSVAVAAYVTADGEMPVWSANSAISRDKMRFVGKACTEILSAMNRHSYPATHAAVALGENCLLWKEYGTGVFVLYLNSPVNDEVEKWLWTEVDAILAEEL
jgi:hypothetical protein